MNNTEFKQRGPAAVFFLTIITFGIYSIFWLADTKNTMEARGAKVGATWHLFIPILSLIWLWKWCQATEHVSQGRLSAGTSFIKIWLLGPIGMAMLQSSFNELSGGQPAAPPVPSVPAPAAE